MALADDIARAIALREESQFTEALAILLDLYEQHPDDARVNHQLARTYDRQGVEDEAIGFYEHAIECGLAGEDLRNALLGLGSSYRVIDRSADSVRVLQKGIVQFPDAQEFKVFLALSLFNLGELREARRLLLEHVADFSSDPGVQSFRRALHYYAQHPDAADEE
ncbi:MAG: tetratricopeptide repeat protein [Betaproteobacteria bacterium]|nr:tetratricopeptide repeat protein [Betaproteobacteria bacterium]